MHQFIRGSVYKLMLGIGLSLHIFSCNPKLNPRQPEERYNELKAQSAQQLSVINVPVTVSMLEVEKQINAQLKDLIYEDSSLANNNNDNFLIKIWKREAITVNAANEAFHITVPLRIWAKGELPFDKIGLNISEFKETEFSLNVHFTSRVRVDSSWKVHTTTTANGFDWVHKPTLKIGFIELSLAPIANRIIDKQQGRLAQLVDKQVEEKIKIKKHVQKAWKTIQQPILLSKEYNTWLKIIPTEILMTPLNGQGKQATALLGIKGYTQTSIGQKPTVDTTKKILPLKIVKEIPDDVSIGLSGEVSHEYATEVLKSKFMNQDFYLNEGRYTITLTDIDLYGSGDDLIIKADITGSLDGTIYLKGKPYFDPESQTLSLLNLDYDLDTKNKLIKTASWLAKGKFVKSMQEAFRIPLGDHIEQAKELIQSHLANKQLAKGVVLNGQIEDLTPADVYITPTSIIATVLAKGKVNVNIEGL